jgi:hypothetical protein
MGKTGKETPHPEPFDKLRVNSAKDLPKGFRESAE